MKNSWRICFLFFVCILAAGILRAQSFSDSLLIGSWKIAWHQSAAGKSAPADTTLTCSFYANHVYQDVDREREYFHSEQASAITVKPLNVTFQSSWELSGSLIILRNPAHPWDNPRHYKPEDVRMMIVSLTHDSLVLEAVTDKKHTNTVYSAQVHYYRVPMRPRQIMRLAGDEEKNESSLQATRAAGFYFRNARNAKRTVPIRYGDPIVVKLSPSVSDAAEISFYEVSYTAFPDSINTKGIFLRVMREKFEINTSGNKWEKGERSYGKFSDTLKPVFVPWSRIIGITYNPRNGIHKLAGSLRFIGMTGVMLAPLSAIRFAPQRFDSDTYLAVAGSMAMMTIIALPVEWITRPKNYSLCNGGMNGKWLLMQSQTSSSKKRH